jgi:hypothetical protein
MKWFLFLCLFNTFAISQNEFDFTLFFSDSENNKDSITLGYAPGATKELDEQFSEIDISDIPIKEGLDVRVFILGGGSESNKGFETKKSITPIGNCADSSIFNTFAIFTKYWPVTISWEKSLFNGDCSENSVITSIPTDVASSLDLDEIQLKDSSSYILKHKGQQRSSGYARGSDTAYFLYHGFSTHVFDRGRTSIKHLGSEKSKNDFVPKNIYQPEFEGRLINGVLIK